MAQGQTDWHHFPGEPDQPGSALPAPRSVASSFGQIYCPRFLGQGIYVNRGILAGFLVSADPPAMFKLSR